MAINSSGDITLEGTLTAENYVVSSSVTNQTIAGVSGSTTFGDDINDVHNFTGSLFTSGSNLSIGSSVTNSTLNLFSPDNTQVQFQDNATGTGAGNGVRVGWNGSVGQFFVFENAGFRIATNNQERITVEAGGDVGIGTTSPDGTLHIHESSAGSVTAGGEADNLVIEADATPGMSILFPNNSKGNISFGCPADNDQFTIVADTNNGRFSFTAAHASHFMQFSVGGTRNLKLSGGDGSELAEFTGNVSGSSTSSASFGTGVFSEAVRIHAPNAAGLNQYLSIRPVGTSVGKSGLGLMSNNGEMTVFADEDDATTSGVFLRVGGNNQAEFRKTAVSFPIANYKISGSSTSTGSFGVLQLVKYNQGIGDVGSTVFGVDAAKPGMTGTENTAIGSNALTDITSGGGNTAIGREAAMNLTTGEENVAIGKLALATATSPGLNVAVGNEALRLTNTGGSNTAVGRESGYSGTTHSGSVFIGERAGYEVTTGNENIAIGHNAMNGGTIVGDQNIAIGAYSGDALTSGYQNVLLGGQAGGAINSGYLNTAIGHEAGKAITTGIANTILGWNAGLALQTGHNNVFIGREAGKGVTTTVQNIIAIGHGAAVGVMTTAANASVFIGASAGAANTSGNGNVAIGYQALTTNVDGDRNTAVGYGALATHEADTDGHGENTALGYQAGGDVSSGTGNTLIGSRAGNQGTDDITTGDNNTLIGKEARASGAGGNNQTVIGASAVGLGDNQTVIGNSSQTHVVFGGDAIISGSAASTGSFGKVEVKQKIVLPNNSNLNRIVVGANDGGKSLNVDNSIYLSSGNQVTWANGDARMIEGAPNNYDLSVGGFDGSSNFHDFVFGGSTTGNVFSGSATSTGSFGSVLAKGTGRNTFLGRVGIGTTDVGQELLVQGANNSAGDTFTVVGAGNVPNITIQNAGTSDDTNSALFFKDNDSHVAAVICRYLDHSPNSAELRFAVTNNGTSRERVVISSSGSLGVGMPTFPATHGIGSIYFSGTELSGSAASTGSFGNGFFAKNVGIGVESPHVPLEVQIPAVDAGTGIRVTDDDGTAIHELSKVPADHGVYYLYNGAGTLIHQLHSNGDSFFMGEGDIGGVGIGTKSPDKDLHLHQNNSNALFEAITIRTNSVGEGLNLGIRADNSGFIHSQADASKGLRLSGNGKNVSNGEGHLFISSSGQIRMSSSADLPSNEASLLIEGSGSNVFTVNGTNGTLFSVNDEMSGSIFSANTVAGIPVIEATSNYEVKLDANNNGEVQIGNSGQQPLITVDTSAQKLNMTTNTSMNTNVAFIRTQNSTTYGASVLAIQGDRNTTNSSYNFIAANNSAVSGQFVVRDSGNVINTNNSYGATSDIKLKQDIVDAGSQWDDIKDLKFKKFRWKAQPSGSLMLGLIAQDVEKTSPGLVEEAIDRDDNGNDLGTTTKNVSYSVMQMKAVVALQEALTRIEELEAKVKELESKV